LFGNVGVGESQPVRELAPYRLLLLQRSVEAFDGSRLTLEKSHGKDLSRIAIIYRISRPIQCV